MFREIARTAGGQDANDTGGIAAAPARVPLRAALLDRNALPGALAARTAAAALADVPQEGRALGRGRTGVIMADTPEAGAPAVGDWVREQLGLLGDRNAPGGPATLGCSLRAIAAACDILNTGDLDLVLAGGVSVGIDPAWLSQRAMAGSLSAEDIRIYDARPTGTLPGEGCGVVALMRAPDARSAGLPVYAEIAGWCAGSGQDAEGGGAEQLTVIRSAYLRAGVDPANVQFVEGHGAATAEDDLAELSALLDVLDRPGGPRCALGAVSANIGDARGAAGVAALLKTAFAMTAGAIPPATGCVQPHRLLRGQSVPFRLPAEPEPWPETGIKLAAVNSLGAVLNSPPTATGSPRTGAVHLVLRRDQDRTRRAGRRRRTATVPQPRQQPWKEQPLAAPPGERFAAHVPAPRVATGPQTAMTAPCRPPRETVIAVRGADRDDLAVTLDTIALTAGRLSPAALREFALELADTPADDRCGARAAILAADPGQLAERASAAAATLRSTATLRSAAPAPPGVWLSEGASGRIAILFPGLASTPLEHTAMLSASLATLAALDRLGVEPHLAVGYSLGEITGLAWAGCITFGDAARLAAYRAETIRAVPHHAVMDYAAMDYAAMDRAVKDRATKARAAMARVLAEPDVIGQLCAGTGLVLAANEGPRQQVLAGPAAGIRGLPCRAGALGADVDVLATPYALHSPAMQRCIAPMRTVTSGMRFTVPRRRLISTVTGLDVTASPDIPGLIAEQLARPALLASALALAIADADLILLAGPDRALATAVAAFGRVPVLEPPLDRRSVPVPTALAALFSAGAIRDACPAN
jgi:enediyne polyketide synthase